jgi:hypothetical protein
MKESIIEPKKILKLKEELKISIKELDELQSIANNLGLQYTKTCESIAELQTYINKIVQIIEQTEESKR